MKKALFKTGDKVEYLGIRSVKSGTGVNPVYLPSIFPGMVAEITETKPPQKGLVMIWVEDEYINDLDDDGYNVYTNEHGRSAIIWPERKKDWKLL